LLPVLKYETTIQALADSPARTHRRRQPEKNIPMFPIFGDWVRLFFIYWASAPINAACGCDVRLKEVGLTIKDPIVRVNRRVAEPRFCQLVRLYRCATTLTRRGMALVTLC
jgi:hypothetical protein